ncbi:hypothetical protein GF386_03230 [Candidatus Pacearchaeota archaeon]|nr:hypothetical protein [Candidatus Pacearchaeota archaeon]MBD3283153.1 hypothetical protein [Candidatus Pacearchaeota archaeon]
MGLERNIAKSFRMAKEDIENMKSQLKEISEKQKELYELLHELKRKKK